MEFEPRLAFEHLDKLAYEIGPRLAGTKGEKQAAEYIRKQLESYGYEIEVQEFEFVDRVTRTMVRGTFLFAAFVASLFLSAEASSIAFAASLSLPHALLRVTPKRISRNIIGTLAPEKPEGRVMVSAHYDSARCLVSHRLNIFLKLILAPAVIAFAACLLARLAGLMPPTAWPIAWALLSLIFLPTCIGMLVSVSSRQISPGANDNASGVAVMLEAARVAAEQHSSDVGLLFAAFGAEEEGMQGSREFAVKLEAKGEKISILNLEMLGVGEPFVVEGNGLLRRTQTSSKLNEVLIQCCKRVGLKPKLWWAPLAGHDHIPLVRAGLRATTFTMDLPKKDRLGEFMGKLFRLPNSRARGYRHIHTPEDIPDRVKLSNIEHAGLVVLEFIKVRGGAAEI